MLPVTGNNLETLIPQKPPFVMVDRLIAADGIGCTTSFIIRKGNVLCDNGKFNTSGLLENMAQTAAVMAGYNLTIEKKEQEIGFIGDIRNFVYTQLPHVGDEIITSIKINNEVFGVTMISAIVTLHTEAIAWCDMKIFKMPKND